MLINCLSFALQRYATQSGIFMLCLGLAAPLQGQNLGIFSTIYIDSGASLALHDTAIHFNDGLIQTTAVQPGQVALFGSTPHFNASDNSHITAPTVATAKTDFIFPVGDNGIYQPFSIENGDGLSLSVQFRYSAPPLADLPTTIDQLSPNFYWSVLGNEQAHLQLSWTTFSQLSAWVEDLSTLRILGYTGTAWEDIPAQLAPVALSNNNPTSLNEGSIGTVDAIDFTRYSALTLGIKSSSDTPIVHQGLTPNGDGVNDGWVIEGIENHPDAQIRVYSRWGREVFAHNGPNPYNNDWAGIYESARLPAASYYYRIDLDADGEVDMEGWIFISD